MLNFIVFYNQIPDKRTFSEKYFPENKWWWLRDCRRNRGRDERNLEWQDETGEEQDPPRWGAWEAVCSAAWLTHNRSATARAPPRVRRNRAHYAPTVNRQIHLFRCTKWQVEIRRKTNRHRYIGEKTVQCSMARYWSNWIKDKWGICLSVCLWAAAETRS